jgi:hypothetical protein
VFSLLGFMAWEKWKTVSALYLGAIPAVVILANLVYAIFVAVGARMPSAPIALLALFSGLFLPILAHAPARARRLAAALAFVGSACIATFGVVTAKCSETEPCTDSLTYTLDHDTGVASWLRGRSRDRWVELRVPASAASSPLPGFTRSDREVATAHASRLDLAPADVTVRSDVVAEGTRKLTVHVTSPRHARCLRMWDAGGAQILSSPEIDGAPVRDFPLEGEKAALRRMTGDDTARVWHMLHCGLSNSGLDVALTARTGEPIRLRIVEETEGLPVTGDGPMPPRPPDLLPAQDSDVTLVGRTLRL